MDILDGVNYCLMHFVNASNFPYICLVNIVKRFLEVYKVHPQRVVSFVGLFDLHDRKPSCSIKATELLSGSSDHGTTVKKIERYLTGKLQSHFVGFPGAGKTSVVAHVTRIASNDSTCKVNIIFDCLGKETHYRHEYTA